MKKDTLELLGALATGTAAISLTLRNERRVNELSIEGKKYLDALDRKNKAVEAGNSTTALLYAVEAQLRREDLPIREILLAENIAQVRASLRKI